MTEKTILFRCGSAEVYQENGCYYDRGALVFVAVDAGDYYFCRDGGLLAFEQNSDIAMVDGEPLDILLQCLEHRLATRNLAEPVLERTNALECLRNLRRWLAELEDRRMADRERTTP